MKWSGKLKIIKLSAKVILTPLGGLVPAKARMLRILEVVKIQGANFPRLFIGPTARNNDR